MSITFPKTQPLRTSATAPAPTTPPGTGKTLSAGNPVSTLRQNDTFSKARPPVGSSAGGATRFEPSKPHVNAGSFDVAPAPSALATCPTSQTRADADPESAAYARAMSSAKDAIRQTLTPLTGHDFANLAGGVVAALGLRSPIVPRLEPAFEADGRLRLDALHAFGADDLDASTRGDVSRSSANASVVALVLRGKGSLLWALDGIRGEMQHRIHDFETSAATRKQSTDIMVRSLWRDHAKAAVELQSQVKELDAITARIRANTASVQDLNRIAVTLDGLFHSFSPFEIEKMNRLLDLVPATAQFRDIEHPSSAGTITYGRVGTPNHAVRIDGTDLASEEVRKARSELAGQIVGQIPDGQSALVGLYLSTPSALSTDPLPARFLNVGKTGCGELYVHDSAHAPHYRTGPDAQEYLASQIGFQIANRRRTAQTETFDLIPAAAFLLQSRAPID